MKTAIFLFLFALVLVQAAHENHDPRGRGRKTVKECTISKDCGPKCFKGCKPYPDIMLCYKDLCYCHPSLKKAFTVED